MIEFNKNYFGHNLISYIKFYDKHDYICTYCGIKLHFHPKQTSKLYYFIDELINDINSECELTCEEYIIKMIIE